MKDFGILTIIVWGLSDIQLVYRYQQGLTDRWGWHLVKECSMRVQASENDLFAHKLGRST